MIINDLMELVNKLFYGDSDENIYIADDGDRETYKYSDMTVKQIKQYRIETLEGIYTDSEGIYIRISR